MHLRQLLGLTSIAIVAACSDNTAPTEGLSVARDGDGGGKWSSTGTYSTESSTTTLDKSTETLAGDACSIPNGIRHATDAPALVTYDTTVAWVVGNEDEIEISYLDHSGDPGRPFMMLSLPQNAVLLDSQGAPVPPGNTAYINIKLHPTCFFAEFQPHGSTFTNDEPAGLWFSTWYAELGAVSKTELSVWYQPDSATAWETLPTVFERRGNWLKAPLDHFSNYAVAW